jgi:nicotinamidase-related amidase
MLIRSSESCLLVVDIQNRLLPAVFMPEQVVANTRILIQAANRIGVPVLASEQYPQGLGETVSEVAAVLPPACLVEKVSFSCMGDEGFADRFHALGRNQAILAGIEAHVCVLQTAEHLLERGTNVFIVGDAVSSRSRTNHAAALDRLQAAGARVVTTEMVVFEWLGRAGTPEFKDLSLLVR